MKKSDNSIKRDMVFAVFGIGLFLASLVGAGWVDRAFGLTEAFSLVDVASAITRVFVASALSFALLRVAFRNTLGKDFGAAFDAGWIAMETTTKTKCIIVAVLVFFATIMLSSASANMASLPASKTPTLKGLPLPVSYEARDMIVNFEVGGKSYYQRRLNKPTWPGGASGVTVGFGYDLGYNTAQQIEKDWGQVVGKEELRALKNCSGKKGSAGKYALSAAKYRVHVTWEEAQKVFDDSTLPRFTALTKRAFLLSEDRLHPDCNGALVSLVFNRGSSMSGSRRTEMRNIRDHIATGYAGRVPREITAMKRLWVGKGLPGLLTRRNAEARLFSGGLSAKK